jgi:type II secretory pathway component PulK
MRGNAVRFTHRSERGSAVLLVLVLVAVMVMVSMSNTDTLDSLKKELKLIDRQQQEKYEQGSGH